MMGSACSKQPRTFAAHSGERSSGPQIPSEPATDSTSWSPHQCRKASLKLAKPLSFQGRRFDNDRHTALGDARGINRCSTSTVRRANGSSCGLNAAWTSTALRSKFLNHQLQKANGFRSTVTHMATPGMEKAICRAGCCVISMRVRISSIFVANSPLAERPFG